MPDVLIQTYARELAPTPRRVERLIETLDRRRRAPAVKARLPRAWFWIPAMGVALGALVLWISPPTSEPRPQPPGSVAMRGAAPVPGAPEARVGVQLRLAVERGSEIQALPIGQAVAVGDRAYFRVSATGPGRVTVWVEGPAGTIHLSDLAFDDERSIDLAVGEELVAWRFDEAGRYQFFASSTGFGECVPATCAQQSVEVR